MVDVFVMLWYCVESPVKPAANVIETVDLTADSDDNDFSSYTSEDTTTISCHSPSASSK